MAVTPAALFANTILLGNTFYDLFTVPAGHVVTVKTIFTYNFGSASGQSVFYHVTPPGNDVHVYKTGLLSLNQFAYFDGWFVVEAGWKFRAITSANSTWELLVSGTLREL